MTTRLIDTNIIVRHLTQDHPKHAAIADRLFAACDRGDLTLIVLPEVLAECIFVLESFYRKPRELIGRTMATLLGSPGIRVSDFDIHRDALARYSRSNLHFVDCTIAAVGLAEGLPVATFDTDLGKVAGVRVVLDL
jgi:predicted nucleic-acid-binding protein